MLMFSLQKEFKNSNKIGKWRLPKVDKIQKAICKASGENELFLIAPF